MLDYFDDKNTTKNKTVLIVDEEQDLVVYLANQCRSIGLTVLVANDATAAMEIIDRGMPDLLMLDVDTPARNGQTLLECLGAHSKGREIPAIVLCTNTDLNSVPKVETMIAYYVHKSRKNWNRIETFVGELIDINPSTTTNSPDLENSDNLNKGTNQ